jgi:hypothetical protein
VPITTKVVSSSPAYDKGETTIVSNWKEAWSQFNNQNKGNIHIEEKSQFNNQNKENIHIE